MVIHQPSGWNDEPVLEEDAAVICPSCENGCATIVGGQCIYCWRTACLQETAQVEAQQQLLGEYANRIEELEGKYKRALNWCANAWLVLADTSIELEAIEPNHTIHELIDKVLDQSPMKSKSQARRIVMQTDTGNDTDA